MKTVKACLTLVMLAVLFVGMANAMPLNSSARAVVPADLQQLISVDYRALRDSPTATALKAQLMDSQENVKEFEGALKGVGINPDKDIDTLALPSFRTAKQGIKVVFIASGPFNMKAVLKKMTLQKIKATKYHTSNLYPMDGGLVMTFLDDSTLLFGELFGGEAGAGYARWRDPESRYELDHVGHDVERGCGGFLEHSGPAGFAEYDAVGAGRCGQDRRLRDGQEAGAGFVLHHGLFERREFRSDGRDFGLDHCGDASRDDEGGHHVQEKQRLAG